MLRRQVLNGSKMKIYYSRSKNVKDASINPLIGDFIQALPDHIRSNVELSKYDMGSSYDSGKLKNADLVIVGLNEETTSIGKGCYSELKEAFNLGIPVLCLIDSLKYAQTIDEDDLHLVDEDDWTNYAELAVFDYKDDLLQDSNLYTHLPSQKGQNKAAVFFVDDSKEIALYLKLIGFDKTESKPKGKLKLDNKEELLAYANKHYTIGTKFISPENGRTYTCSGDIHVGVRPNNLLVVSHLNMEYIYYDGNWAEIITEETTKLTTTDFKEGDWVIGWHIKCDDWRRKPWQVGKVEYICDGRAHAVRPLYHTDLSYITNKTNLRKLTEEEVLEWVKKEYPLDCNYRPFYVDDTTFFDFYKPRQEGSFYVNGYTIDIGPGYAYYKGKWAVKQVQEVVKKEPVEMSYKDLVMKCVPHNTIIYLTKSIYFFAVSVNQIIFDEDFSHFEMKEIPVTHLSFGTICNTSESEEDWKNLYNVLPDHYKKQKSSEHLKDAMAYISNPIVEMNKTPRWNRPTSSYQTNVSDNDILLLLK